MSHVVRPFCLDTSFLINGWQKHYRRDVFPTIWDTLDTLSKQGLLSSCDEVYRDLEKQDDDLFAWARARRRLFQAPTEDTIDEVKRILAAYPNYAASGGRINRSDPWIIAHTRVVGGIIVTDETPAPHQRSTLPPKMPDVCDALGIPWMKPIDFLAKAGMCL